MSVETRFGPYGGRYVPETLIPALDELTAGLRGGARRRGLPGRARAPPRRLRRPPHAALPRRAALSERCGATVLLKREDLCHTGAHKINNVLGQALLAERMGKRRVIAETGAGQHGVATATACALLDLECVVYMGSEDMRRQELNVVRMRLLGAEVVPVESGSRTLKDAMNEALRDWVDQRARHLLRDRLGRRSGALPGHGARLPGGHRPRDAGAGAGAHGRLPDEVVACVGGGSNAMGIFHAFRERPGASDRRRGGRRRPRQRPPRRLAHPRPPRRAARLVLLPAAGRLGPGRRGALGLCRARLPRRRPEHAWLHDSGRAAYAAATRRGSAGRLPCLAGLEGIIPALESAHAVAYVLRGPARRGAVHAQSPSACRIPPPPALPPATSSSVNLSGRGDKDVAHGSPVCWRARHDEAAGAAPGQRLRRPAGRGARH